MHVVWQFFPKKQKNKIKCLCTKFRRLTQFGYYLKLCCVLNFLKKKIAIFFIYSIMQYNQYPNYNFFFLIKKHCSRISIFSHVSLNVYKQITKTEQLLLDYHNNISF